MFFLFGRSQRLFLKSSTQCNRKVSNACTALWSSDSWLAVKPCMVRISEIQGGRLNTYIESHMTVTAQCFVDAIRASCVGWMINFKGLKCCGCDIILEALFGVFLYNEDTSELNRFIKKHKWESLSSSFNFEGHSVVPWHYRETVDIVLLLNGFQDLLFMHYSLVILFSSI